MCKPTALSVITCETENAQKTPAIKKGTRAICSDGHGIVIFARRTCN